MQHYSDGTVTCIAKMIQLNPFKRFSRVPR